MTPDERFRLERSRFTVLAAARATGVVFMMIGLWVWLGDLVRTGGEPRIGVPLFALGFIESLVLPQILIRKWRTPPADR